MGIRTSNYIEINPLNNYNTSSRSLQKQHHHFNYINDINHHHHHKHHHINKNTTIDDDGIYELFNQSLNDPMIKYNQLDDYILTKLYNSSFPSSKYYNYKPNTIYGCKNCKTHLSTTFNIISKDYRGVTGNAYLMSNVTNVQEGDYELRAMITGDYLVCDIICQMCKNIVGWKYITAERSDQQYKEGKFILELQTITIVE